jgi:Acyl-CoA dehydrogenase, C-terminal domain
LKLTVPRRFGGYEVDICTKMEVSAAVAEADGATGWIVALVDVCHWLAGLLREQAQQDIFGADPDARVCGVLAPSPETRRVDGGLVVSGRWALGLRVAARDLVPRRRARPRCRRGNHRARARVRSDERDLGRGHVVRGRDEGDGLEHARGRGGLRSRSRLLPMVPAIGNEYPTEHVDEVLYRSSFIPVLAIILVGPLLGLARAARDLVIAKAPSRAISLTSFEHQSDSVAFQVEVARAAMTVDTAHLHAMRSADVIDDAARRGEKLDYARSSTTSPARACAQTRATRATWPAWRSTASSRPTARRASPTPTRCNGSGATRTPPAATRWSTRTSTSRSTARRCWASRTT